MLIAIGNIPEHVKRAEWENRYVKQLEIINCNRDDILSAIRDYLNSVAKRTQLAKNGYLTKNQLQDFDRNLEDHWKSKFSSLKISHRNLSSEDIGQLIYFDTTDYDTSVGEFVLRSHFLTKGSYHALANKMTVGWHPEYSVLLKLKGTIISVPKKAKKNV